MAATRDIRRADVPQDGSVIADALAAVTIQHQSRHVFSPQNAERRTQNAERRIKRAGEESDVGQAGHEANRNSANSDPRHPRAGLNLARG
jgi:hypothetical protein